jgi:penicillin amidase
MRWLKRGLWVLCLVVAAGAIVITLLVNPFGPSPINNYKTDGHLVLDGLTEPVRVIRDEKGMAYIYARNKNDLIMTQGYVTAADRLFQMELMKLMSAGRIGELAGPAARSIDVTMRTLGFRRHAQAHWKVLNEETRLFLQRYADGVNAFIRIRPSDLHLEFKLARIQPGQWTPVDSLSIMYYMGWHSAANLQHEIVAQMLIEKIGYQKARQIFPLNINPSENQSARPEAIAGNVFHSNGMGLIDGLLPLSRNRDLQIGSNNWAVSASRSISGKPIVANDPHLEACMLPGPWYPSALITNDIRAVGATVPGVPGMVVGRTKGMAFGVTNAYGDSQDLYIETLDPEDRSRYLEGGVSLPFRLIEETLKLKDKDAPDGYRREIFTIRLTSRGPVVSDHLKGLQTDNVVTVRWAAFENMKPSIALEGTMSCETAADFRAALRNINYIGLNWVFADEKGDMGWHVSGPLPIRSPGDGQVPYRITDSRDNWQGWIPFADMPNISNPPQGYVSTANHKTVDADYPFYYSNYFSTPYRQRRLMEILGDSSPTSSGAHWTYQRDTENIKAQTLAPLMASVLIRHDATAAMGRILRSWDMQDTCDQAGPTLFHAIFNEAARLIYTDELGEAVTTTMLDNPYFWEERLCSMMVDGGSPWFDDITTTDHTEDLGDMLYQAALNVKDQMAADMGRDPLQWHWGQVHRYDFYSPIARKGVARRLLGGGNFPAAGSGDTLCRSLSNHADLSTIAVMASLRMVIDLGDTDKIMAVLPGGITGRIFHPHTTDQITSFIDGTEVYWWYSDQQIAAHQYHELVLGPGN